MLQYKLTDFNSRDLLNGDSESDSGLWSPQWGLWLPTAHISNLYNVNSYQKYLFINLKYPWTCDLRYKALLTQTPRPCLATKRVAPVALNMCELDNMNLTAWSVLPRSLSINSKPEQFIFKYLFFCCRLHTQSRLGNRSLWSQSHNGISFKKKWI